MNNTTVDTNEDVADIYLRHANTNNETYGERTLTLIESEHFYEVYDKQPPPSSPHLQCCIDVLGILVTRRNKNDPDSPYMAGIPKQSSQRYIDLLQQSNYTVVCLPQPTKVHNQL